MKKLFITFLLFMLYTSQAWGAMIIHYGVDAKRENGVTWLKEDGTQFKKEMNQWG